MTRDTFNKICALAPQVRLLSYSDVERLNILAREVGDDGEDWRGHSRSERLRRVQGDILDIVAPALDGVVESAINSVDGGIALAQVTGQPVAEEDKEMLKAANEVITLMRDIRTGARTIEPNQMADAEQLLCE